ncbi:diguanylate cyclase domain-containing protein [Bacillus sp. JJ1764]|uniref:diguanylate cyclase domain-containing protein n=1 Tax=Bacillus sp. JJ1764 TaxID=3122964 RepID=UPI00300070AA
MIKEYVTNIAILIAAFSLMGQFFKDRSLSVTSSIPTKLLAGFFLGILGNILMIFSIKISSTIIVDLRHLAIVIAAAFGGFFPAMVASIIIALGRFVLFGFSASAVLPAIGAILIGFGCGLVSRLNISETLKAFIMNVYGLTVLSIILAIRIENHSTLDKVLFSHIITSLIGGFVAYHFSVYITKSNQAQRQLEQNIMKLKETEERFRLLAENSSDLITMNSEVGEYIYISPAVKEILHFEYQELLGKKMELFIHPDDLELYKNTFKKALEEGDAGATYRYKVKLGEYIWIESSFKSVSDQEDGNKRVIIVSRNITNRKLTEQKLQEANALLNQLSYLDGLTGISNRRYFDETLLSEWSNSLLNTSPITLMMLDIDYFKKYNDTYGHLEGDYCLQSIAQAIKEVIAPHSTYIFCRYGGEEFAIILPGSEQQKGIHIAEQIQEKIQQLQIPHKSSKIADFVTLSIGIATMIPDPTTSSENLIQKADSALYKSKIHGRNTITSLYE